VKRHPAPGSLIPLEGFLGPIPDPIWAHCLDCNWSTANYSMDGLLEDVGWHEWGKDHLVHISDGL
jgi:hypothetical protein